MQRHAWINFVLISLLLVTHRYAAEPLAESEEEALRSANAFALSVGSATVAGSDTEEAQEHAAFACLVSQMRYRIDRRVYPPADSSSGRGALMGALSAVTSQATLGPVKSDPEAYRRVLERLEAWTPLFPEGYDPGWQYERVLQGEQREQVVRETREKLLIPIRREAILMQDARYAELSQIVGEAQKTSMRYEAAQREYNNLLRRRGHADPVNPDLVKRYNACRKERSAALSEMLRIEWDLVPASRWHAAVGWKATDFFDDEAVVALCHAIESNDLETMQRQIDQGTDVRAVGRDGMTPLLWAFPDQKIGRFRLLLENGADPNVITRSDFDAGSRPPHRTPDGGSFLHRLEKGLAVTHLACTSPNTDYLRLVLRNGGDARLIDPEHDRAPLDLVLETPVRPPTPRVRLLLRHGADPGRYCPYTGKTPATAAVQRSRFGLALELLEAGADPTVVNPRTGRGLLDAVLSKEGDYLLYSDETKEDFDRLVKWLEEAKTPLAELRAERVRQGLGPAQQQQKQARQQAAWDAANRAYRQRRQVVLAGLREKDTPPPEPVSAKVGRLTEQQTQRIELPEDPSTVVFSVERSGGLPADGPERRPWLVVRADGQVAAAHLIDRAADPATHRLNRDQLTWLLHLAANECGVLKLNSADYAEHAEPSDPTPFRFSLTLAREEGTLELPYDCLVTKPLRRKLGLDNFKMLLTLVNEIVFQTHLGNEAESVLQAVNAKLSSEYPEYPPLRAHHLRVAVRHGKNLTASFEREFSLGDKRYETLTASYRRKAGEVSIGFNVKDFSRMR